MPLQIPVGFVPIFSPSSVRTSKREESLGLACIKPLRINTLIWNHQQGPMDAGTSVRCEREAGPDQCSSSKMLCGYTVPSISKG